MNLAFAREVGYLRYLLRRILWRVTTARKIKLPTGGDFPLPKEKFFAADVFVTQANVDWNSEYILAGYLASQQERGDFIDVGAHIGYYTCLIAPLARHVYAFEPDVRNHPYLLEAINPVPNASLVPLAVSDFTGMVGFSDANESSVSHLGTSNQTCTISVECTRLDAYCQQHGIKPSAIKMDIEGFEILALEGAVEIMRNFQPVVLIEFNIEEERPNSWEKLDCFVGNNDYKVYAITRSRKGNGYQYQFKHHQAVDLANLSSKMIFLVHASATAWFDKLVRERPKWTGAVLRPQSVGLFLKQHGFTANSKIK